LTFFIRIAVYQINDPSIPAKKVLLFSWTLATMSEFVFESCDLLLEDDKTFDMLSWTYCGTCLASEKAPLTNHSAGHAIP